MPALLRAAAARLRPGGRERDGYSEFVERVEPVLAARPRVHRFAQPPIVGAGATRVADLAVCVDPAGAGNPAVTYAALERQTVAPAEVLGIAGLQALRSTRAPWLVLLRAGDRLAAIALERLGQAVTLAGEAAVITCDGDELRGGGRRADPRCRPGPSPDALAAGVQPAAPVAVRREPALAAGVPDGEAWELELLLALAGPAGAGHAHVPLILVHRPQKAAPDEAQLAAVERTLGRWGEPGARVEPTGAGRRRVRRPIAGEPAVEVVVAFRDHPQRLERCARSVLDRSTYERLTLRLVDNGSSQPATADLVARLAAEPRVSVIRDPSPFNFAALNNRAARESSADFLVLLNNDTEVVTAAWVAELLEEAQREQVGAVAPLLVYPDGKVQHAGAALGLHGYAGHPFAGLAPDQRTAFGAAGDGTRNWLAVTAACLMVERRKFEAVGGFDESFSVAGNDVDLCLRLTAAGHRSLCLPHVRLIHEESASRDPAAIPDQDFERSRERYGDFRTVGDPFYNPNLTLADTTCALRSARELAA